MTSQITWIWRRLWSLQNEAIPLAVMRWQRIVIGLVKSRHYQSWLGCPFSWNENLQWKQNWTAKSTNLKEKAGQIESVFVIRATQWTKELACCLEYWRSWKYTLGKLAIVVNLEAIRVEFWTERRVSDGGNLCPLWSVILQSVWNSVEDTF